jgi:hypothetical protein
LSDEEFVERIRKNLQLGRRMRRLKIAMGLLQLSVPIAISVVFFRAADEGVEVLERHGVEIRTVLLWAVFGVTVGIGVLVGMWLYQGAFRIFDAFVGERREKLLVQCWDAVQKHRAGNLGK